MLAGWSARLLARIPSRLQVSSGPEARAPTCKGRCYFFGFKKDGNQPGVQAFLTYLFEAQNYADFLTAAGGFLPATLSAAPIVAEDPTKSEDLRIPIAEASEPGPAPTEGDGPTTMKRTVVPHFAWSSRSCSLLKRLHGQSGL